MRATDSRILPRLDKACWVVSAEADGGLTARLCASTGRGGEAESIGSSRGGWDVTLDTDGTPWVVFVSEENGCIAVRRAVEGRWGPSLQVSAERGVEPLIRADEFNNIWVFWRDGSPGAAFACRVCRMGPRSGQEMVAASFDRDQTILDAGCRGGEIWLLAGDREGERWIVCGTEHDGFPPARRIGASLT